MIEALSILSLAVTFIFLTSLTGLATMIVVSKILDRWKK